MKFPRKEKRPKQMTQFQKDVAQLKNRATKIWALRQTRSGRFRRGPMR